LLWSGGDTTELLTFTADEGRFGAAKTMKTAKGSRLTCDSHLAFGSSSAGNLNAIHYSRAHGVIETCLATCNHSKSSIGTNSRKPNWPQL
tara:strand:+ start:1019 stop:1288 length:270 start_codon:yes stop_codon:yes gene_type:complete